ncbi:SOS response-associated peptidase [Pseudogracilibacillus sp. SE30717A]|uniref:SOS response-associated peptidase n=1 Tax=Pseudogracilibacillus sp. SE30717A TaxID=3098293 RepID=UPI00300E5607
MCGRYTLLADELKIRQRFHIPHEIEGYYTSYNIAPSQKVLAVIHDGAKRRAGFLQWGLVPSWAKDEKIGNKMINARSETAHIKPSFKNLMARKRCLIIADSFYEWQKANEGKIPKRIQLEKGKLFAFAGLWDKWQQDDKTLFTCTILTKDANESMQEIHHRMPIILPRDKEDAWISQSFTQAKTAYHFLQNLEEERLSAYSVSDFVNNATNNDATCIEPITK